MKVDFTEKEKDFLNKKGFCIKNKLIEYEAAEDIVEELGWDDYGVAAGIITKITTNDEW